MRMIDLHCHILPGLDDGAANTGIALEMARLAIANGVSTIACTPHILPGLYHNTGEQIRTAASYLQDVLRQEQIPIKLVTGADNHLVPDLVSGLRSGHLLSLADSRYGLVEPPHHVAPLKMADLFLDMIGIGYVPV